MSPQPSTRSKHKRMGREGTLGEANNSPEEGAINQNNNNNPADNSEDEQGAHAVTNHTTDVVPNATDLIYSELSKTNLSGEMLPLANIICKIIQSQFDSFLAKLDKLSKAKDKQISSLESKLSSLENKITQLETNVDDIDQYECRDTVIISGHNQPEETELENASDVIVNSIKHHLHVNMSHSDINIAHRLGRKSEIKKRPIIVKPQNHMKKQSKFKPQKAIHLLCCPQNQIPAQTPLPAVLHNRWQNNS